MYYEIHGDGKPLVMLHGAYHSIVSLGELVPRLAETRQVIGVELQGHGRTADIDRPFSYERFADDVAALLEELNVSKADVFGYSMGGITALHLAVQQPAKVDRLIVASAPYSGNGFHAGYFEMIGALTPELFAGTPLEHMYKRLAPQLEAWPRLVEKMLVFTSKPHALPPQKLQALTAPTLVTVGDADSVHPEHAVEFFQLRGGGVNGDLTGLPNAQLAVLPGTTHITLLSRADWIVPMVTEFLEKPMLKAEYR